MVWLKNTVLVSTLFHVIIRIRVYLLCNSWHYLRFWLRCVCVEAGDMSCNEYRKLTLWEIDFQGFGAFNYVKKDLVLFIRMTAICNSMSAIVSWIFTGHTSRNTLLKLQNWILQRWLGSYIARAERASPNQKTVKKKCPSSMPKKFLQCHTNFIQINKRKFIWIYLL